MHLDEVGRSWACGICCISMLLAVLVFLSGTRRYRYKKSFGSPIVYILQVVVAAARKRKLGHPSSIAFLYENCPEASRIQHTDQFCFLNKAAINMAEGDHVELVIVNGETSTPNPWKLCSVTRIEEVRTTMERSIDGFQIPAESLTVFLVGAILISLAVYDRMIMPMLKKKEQEMEG